jgi:NOL1/NOP2/sun family putative RNA methylase
MNNALPPAFVERMYVLLGAEADAFFAAYEGSPYTGLRVNLLKLTANDFLCLSPWPLKPVPWCPAGFYVAEGARLGKHPYHAAGLYYLQEPSAMAVVEALDVRRGQRVLDLAAAPGGKATQIAALLDNQGLLIANEIESGRIKALGENLERWGAHAIITNETPERLASHFGPFFDRVLLDAPCSGEGMFRKSGLAKAEWSVEHVRGCALRQARILEQAARLVAPGGLLGYSTCTFAPEENEQRIAAFLVDRPGWELVDICRRTTALCPYAAPARPGWAEPPLAELERAVRLWPHRLAGEGHFIALLRNRSSAEQAPERAPQLPRDEGGGRRKRLAGRAQQSTVSVASREMIATWQAWERETLEIKLRPDRLLSRGDQLYLVAEEMPDLQGLRVVRPGLWLGTMKPGRFEPAHALALALRTNEVRITANLSADAAERYLHGGTLDVAGPNGWVLVTVDDWPLGWGRRASGVIKNFYPKGLRWAG